MSRVPISVVTPAHLARCDRDEWDKRVRYFVWAQANITLLRCTAAYAVTDVSVSGESNSPDRHYWRRRTSADEWLPLSRSAEAGCDHISTVDPTFPAELCQDLPGPLFFEDVVTTGTVKE